MKNWDADMCDKAHGYCNIKAEHGRHLESIGNNKNTSVNRTQRLRIPRLLIQSLFDSQGIHNSFLKNTDGGNKIDNNVPPPM